MLGKTRFVLLVASQILQRQGNMSKEFLGMSHCSLSMLAMPCVARHKSLQHCQELPPLLALGQCPSLRWKIKANNSKRLWLRSQSLSCEAGWEFLLSAVPVPPWLAQELLRHSHRLPQALLNKLRHGEQRCHRINLP